MEEGQTNRLAASETAGKLMTTAHPSVVADATIAHLKKQLTETSREYETIDYIYVIDKRGRLTGVISILDVYRSEDTDPVDTVMTSEDLVTVRPSTDQERVAQLAINHNIKAVPVVDKNGTLLGIVTSDTILQILHEENTEDFLRSVGIRKINLKKHDPLDISHAKYLKNRLPWLVIGLLGGVGAASIVTIFESLISEMLILASFIPTIVYLSDAVGSQTQTVVIRNLVLKDEVSFTDVLVRETIVSVGLGAVLGVLMAIISLIFWQDMTLSAILFISVAVTTLISTSVGVILPLAFRKLDLDPAVSSGPLATVIRDILSILTYLVSAMIILGI